MIKRMKHEWLQDPISMDNYQLVRFHIARPLLFKLYTNGQIMLIIRQQKNQWRQQCVRLIISDMINCVLIDLLQTIFKFSQSKKQNLQMNYLSQKPQPQIFGYLPYSQAHQNKTKPQIIQPYIRQSGTKLHTSLQPPPNLLYSKQNPIQLSQNSSKYHQSVQSEDNSKPVQFDRRIFLLMKEQIQVSAANYLQKMNVQLRVQAQQIQRLNSQLINNAHIISKQGKIIKRLIDLQGNSRTVRLDMSSFESRDSNRNASRSPGKLSLTQKKFIEKPKLSHSPIKDPKNELEPKIHLLNRRLEEVNIQLHLLAIKNHENVSKIQSLQYSFSKNIGKKLEQLRERLNLFCQNNQQRYIKVNCMIDSKSNQRRQLFSHLSFLKQETEQIKQLIVNISSREYAYDSYPLTILKEQLKNLTKKLEQMTKNNHDATLTQAQTLNQKKSSKQLNHSVSLQYSQRLNQDMNNQALNRSQLSSLSHYAPKYVKAVEDDRFKRGNDWQLQQDNSSFSSDQDGFFYPEVQSELLISEDMRIERLEKIIAKQCSRLPVKVQIDQTGYIKYSKTGMYILDENGDGFELTSNEIQFLKAKGVIFF